MVDCTKSTILENFIFRNGADGVHISGSGQNVISKNKIYNNLEYGMHALGFSDYNRLLYNFIENNGLGGMYMYEGQNNVVACNNLIDNSNFNAWGNGVNVWWNNFYGDYEGDDANGDEIGDEPYVIQGRRGVYKTDVVPAYTVFNDTFRTNIELTRVRDVAYSNR